MAKKRGILIRRPIDSPSVKAEVHFPEIRIGPYKESRFWGVWVGEELLVVTVYKCGAQSVANLIREASWKHPSSVASVED
jgi:hypothetical protein